MAVIGKIRKHSVLLIVVIGVALAAFVLGDFATGTGRQQTFYVGNIAGQDITITDFNRLFEENLEATRRQSQNDRIPQEEITRIRENTWNQLMQEMIMNKEYENLGIVVTPEELFDMVQGPNPHFAIIQNFTNPETGQYDRELVVRYLQNLDQMPQANKDQWMIFEKFLKEDRLRNKYQNLIIKGYYIPNAFAKLSYEEKNDKVSGELVGVRFSTVADSLIKPTDKDYKAYYERNKVSFERQESRDIEYVVFDVVPSERDMSAAEELVKGMMQEFAATDNIAGFVNANSESRYDSTWFGRTDLPVIMENDLFEAETGSIHGPYFDNGAYKIARLVDITSRPDSMRASHILIAYDGAMRSEQKRTKDEAKAKADSIFNVVKRSPSKMADLAKTLSDDPSAAQNNGDLDWFRDGQMVPQFNQYVLDNKVGSLGLVETDFGFHIIEVTGKKDPAKKIRVAIITHQVTPSTLTYQEVFAQASRFATQSKTREQFEASIENLGLNKRIGNALRSTTYTIAGMQNARQVVRWAFDSNTGIDDVSTIFDLDNMYVIATLTKIQEKGIPPLEEVKDMMEPQVKNLKKGEYLVERMKPFASDLSQLATAFNTEVSELTSVTFETRNLAGFGNEPIALGELFALRPAAISQPFAGNNAAFVLKMNDITKSSERSNYDATRNELSSAFEQQIRNNTAYRAIEKASKIEDNRLLFF
jgi:peptidyl-prolyl cis-trans isomerase D